MPLFKTEYHVRLMCEKCSYDTGMFRATSIETAERRMMRHLTNDHNVMLEDVLRTLTVVKNDGA